MFSDIGFDDTTLFKNMKQNAKQTHKYFSQPDGWESLSRLWRETTPQRSHTLTDHFLYLFVTGRDVQRAFRKLNPEKRNQIAMDLYRLERKLANPNAMIYPKTSILWHDHLTVEALNIGGLLLSLYSRALW